MFGSPSRVSDYLKINYEVALAEDFGSFTGKVDDGGGEMTGNRLWGAALWIRRCENECAVFF